MNLNSLTKKKAPGRRAGGAEEIALTRSGPAAQARSASAAMLLEQLHSEALTDDDYVREIEEAWWVNLLGKGFIFEVSDPVTGERLHVLSMGSSTYSVFVWRLKTISCEGRQFFRMCDRLSQASPVMALFGHQIGSTSATAALGVTTTMRVPAQLPVELSQEGLHFEALGPAEALIRFALKSRMAVTVPTIKKMMVVVGARLPRGLKECKATLLHALLNSVLSGEAQAADRMHALVDIMNHPPAEEESCPRGDPQLEMVGQFLPQEEANEFERVLERNAAALKREEAKKEKEKRAKRNDDAATTDHPPQVTPPHLRSRQPGQGLLSGVWISENVHHSYYRGFYRGATPKEMHNKSWPQKRTQEEALEAVLNWLQKQHALACRKADELAEATSALNESRADDGLESAAQAPVQVPKAKAKAKAKQAPTARAKSSAASSQCMDSVQQGSASSTGLAQPKRATRATQNAKTRPKANASAGRKRGASQAAAPQGKRRRRGETEQQRMTRITLRHLKGLPSELDDDVITDSSSDSSSSSSSTSSLGSMCSNSPSE